VRLVPLSTTVEPEMRIFRWLMMPSSPLPVTVELSTRAARSMRMPWTASVTVTSVTVPFWRVRIPSCPAFSTVRLDTVSALAAIPCASALRTVPPPPITVHREST
jgi:hypothetical protein